MGKKATLLFLPRKLVHLTVWVRNLSATLSPVKLLSFKTVKFPLSELTSAKSHIQCVSLNTYILHVLTVLLKDSLHNDSRMLAGKYLAQEFPVEADVVIGVPDSGLSAAMGYAKESGIPYDIGFVKNKYIGRTFIQPSQAMRENSVRIKLNVLKSTVEGKRVVMVDDSIVRGTTSKRIVKPFTSLRCNRSSRSFICSAVYVPFATSVQTYRQRISL